MPSVLPGTVGLAGAPYGAGGAEEYVGCAAGGGAAPYAGGGVGALDGGGV